jgi:dTDP-3-amino-3,4,6-trideoxy-alpha-D-glucose transaminase
MSSATATHEPARAAGKPEPTHGAATTTAATPAPADLATNGTPARTADVPFTRMDNADPELFEELMGTVREVAERGAFTLGHHVEAFERDFAAYCETDCAVGVASGTEALALALRALEIGPGDEVIVPANSFIATAEAVSAVGATPRPVDVDPDTHLITAELLAAGLGPRVRCVIPVHLFGATVELDPILELAREAGIHVLEDACQAHGARYRGRRVGTFGALGCFSFYPAKNLGAWGDGGAVITAHADLAERVRLLRSHGERPRYHHREVGATARLDALQAAILRRKLARLDGWNDERRRIGETLRTRLATATPDAAPPAIDDVRAVAVHGGQRANGAQGVAAARTSPCAVEPVRPPVADGDHVYHLFVVRCAERDALRAHLEREGVASAIHYPVPIHRTEAYAALDLQPGSLPVSEALAERICSLPIFPGMSAPDIDRILGAVESFTKDGPRRAR